jgi:NADPH:quinone reductase-like Zn-dependent oxidoreductase
MKAVALTRFGGPEELRLKELPVRALGPGEVAIRVRAAAVNPIDWRIRQGGLQGRVPHEFPLIPGWEAAGIIEDPGDTGEQWRVGDRVFCYCRKSLLRDGAYAERLNVAAEAVAAMPGNLSFVEAASVPLGVLTAYQALFDRGHLLEGQTVLIQAAAGSVGAFAVQLAKQAWATVL